MKPFFVIVTMMLITLSSTVAAGLACAAPAAPYYVALGDSRATGSTAVSFIPGDHCARTADGYPVKLAAELGVSFRTVACSGATSEQVLDGQRVLGLNQAPPQVDALSADTKLITISVGGNDIGWTGLISPCFSFVGDARCRTNTGMAARIDTTLAALPARIDRLLTEVNRRSPDAQVIVVGHGGYFGAKGCFPDAPMSSADAVVVADFFDRFNGVLHDSAHRAGATYVDIVGPARGHDACAGRNKWFNGLWPHGNESTQHPTRLGSKAMAAEIRKAIR
ncbi:SGNH/GDSL hydrolase family protein [Gordonia sp. NPDC003376]